MDQLLISGVAGVFLLFDGVYLCDALLAWALAVVVCLCVFLCMSKQLPESADFFAYRFPSTYRPWARGVPRAPPPTTL